MSLNVITSNILLLRFGNDFPASRDEVISALHAENVLARRYFWPGCHRMKPYRDLFPWADIHLSSTNAVASRVIVLPTGTSVGDDEIEVICRIIAMLSSG